MTTAHAQPVVASGGSSNATTATAQGPRRLMIRYRVHPESIEENEKLVRAVFLELNAKAPAGLRYATFKLDDGRTFVHVVSFDAPTDDALRSLASFEAFVSTVRDRCDEMPVSTKLHEVGSYGW